MSIHAFDGVLETIDAHRLTLGCVVRRLLADKAGMPAFSDAVVTAIWVRTLEKRVEYFPTLGAAIARAKMRDYVEVQLTRPYLYCHNIGGSNPGYLQSVEVYTVDADRLIETYKVVVQSSGEYACFSL